MSVFKPFPKRARPLSWREELQLTLRLVIEMQKEIQRVMADTQATLDKLNLANQKIDVLGVAISGVRGDIAGLKAIIVAGGTPDEVAAAVDTMSTNLDAKVAELQALDAETDPVS